MLLGTNISSKVKEGIRWAKFYVFGITDVREKRQATSHGIDAHPTKNAIVLVTPTQLKGEEIVLGVINKNQLAKVGELHLYSTDADGVEKVRISIKNDGTIEFGGDADFLARFNELKAGFDQLKQDHNTHLHTSAAPGSPTSTVTVPSGASIDNAKIDNLKCT